LKIRIFALAKELNLDSKELIEACSKIGIVLKNSALASISPEEKDKVLDFLNSSEAKKDEAAAAPEKPVPVRPPMPTREPIKNLGTKIRQMIGRPRPTQSTEAEGVEETAVEEAIETKDEASAEPAPAPESKPEVVAPAAEDRPHRPIEISTTARPSIIQPHPPAGSGGTEKDSDASGADSDEDRPMRQEDYIAPTGTGLRSMMGKSGIPVAGDSVKGQRRQKVKPGPALPQLPRLKEFKGPATTAQPEGAAQKPDMKLPASVLSGARPLDEILRKNAEDKEKRKGDERKVRGRGNLKGLADLAEEDPRIARGLKGTGAAATGKKDRSGRRGGAGFEEDDDDVIRVRSPRRARSQRIIAPQKTEAVISPPITIRTLSEAISRPANVLIKSLFNKGMMVNINSSIDEDTAMELAMECGVELFVQHDRDSGLDVIDALEAPEEAANLTPRPPIVTILGHVDHGKTTLLDKIRSANVAAGEAGGITQHIAAYQVEHNGQKVTFVDTPGHAAFTEMRARGANVTDIVVLVVAADDGVMPQTVEAINHARAAEVPIVVALNKFDLPGINEQKVLQELSTNNILPVEWGGDVEVIRTSGQTGLGIDNLLETLLLTAEIQELKANPNRPAMGVCLEAFRDEGRGTVAWFMNQNGTLKTGDVVICGETYGRIRAMYNDRDEELSEALPSTPLKVSGLDQVPAPGDKFYVMPDIEEARQLAETRQADSRAEALSLKVKPRTLEDILNPEKAGTVQDLPLILKADTPGSIEALRHELGKLDHPEVRVQILHDGVGGVNESDVSLAQATGAIIVAFHVVPEERARAAAEQLGIDIRSYNIIYEVTDEIKLALEGLLKPELKQIPTGRALVLRTFNISRFGTIAGCRVLNGTIERNNRVRLIRENRILNEYNIGSLKREKDDAKEVREGMECGIRLENFNDIKEGDLLEAYRVEEIKRTL